MRKSSCKYDPTTRGSFRELRGLQACKSKQSVNTCNFMHVKIYVHVPPKNWKNMDSMSFRPLRNGCCATNMVAATLTLLRV